MKLWNVATKFTRVLFSCLVHCKSNQLRQGTDHQLEESQVKRIEPLWAAAPKSLYLPTTKIRYRSSIYQSLYLEDSSCTFFDFLLLFFSKGTKKKNKLENAKKKGMQESPGIYIYIWMFI